MGMVSIVFEFMRRGHLPRQGDKLVMPEGCFKEVRQVYSKEDLTVQCSNPKTCPHPKKCDLSRATLFRNGRRLG